MLFTPSVSWVHHQHLGMKRAHGINQPILFILMTYELEETRIRMLQSIILKLSAYFASMYQLVGTYNR